MTTERNTTSSATDYEFGAQTAFALEMFCSMYPGLAERSVVLFAKLDRMIRGLNSQALAGLRPVVTAMLDEAESETSDEEAMAEADNELMDAVRTWDADQIKALAAEIRSREEVADDEDDD